MKRFRTTRDILIPKGNNVVYVTRMNQVITRQATAIVRLDCEMVYEWFMQFDDALKAGLIEEITEGD